MRAHSELQRNNFWTAAATGKMPSKNKQNAFIVYAQSIRQQLIREGHIIKNTADLVSAASSYWKDLPEHEKNVYKNLAKEQSQNGAPMNGAIKERPNRRDNTGELIANRVNTDEVRRQRMIKERLEVARHWPSGKDIKYERFYFISFSVTLDLRHLDNEELEKIIPCEVSLLEYSLDLGIERTMHKFVNPGKLPLGFRATAMSKSENSHQIPVEGLAEEGDTYRNIYEGLCSFLMVGKKVMPPVFCKSTEVEQTEFALKWLAKNAGMQHVIKKVYVLEGLLIDVEKHLQGQKLDFITSEISKATSYLSKSLYDYERGSRCKFHEENDSKFCSLGVVKRWSYLMSSHLCSLADVMKTQNHLPTVYDDEDIDVTSESSNFQPTSIKQSTSNAQPQQQNYENKQQLQQKQQFRQQQHEQEQQQFRQQQHQQRYRPTQPQRNSATTPTATRSTRQESMGVTANQQSKPLPTGRGRGLAQALSQQRRPGERPQEPRKLAAGRGRASIAAMASVGNSSVGTNSAAGGTENEPSTRPKNAENTESQKFASLTTAPPASLAPQPPSAWMFGGQRSSTSVDQEFGVYKQAALKAPVVETDFS